MEELFIYVPPEEAQAVIVQDEMKYEEYKWYSMPNRIRIAKINANALREPANTTIKMTFFPGSSPSNVILSNGITGGKWTGRRSSEKIPKADLEEALKAQKTEHMLDSIDRHFNRTEFSVSTWIKNPETGDPVWLPSSK